MMDAVHYHGGRTRWLDTTRLLGVISSQRHGSPTLCWRDAEMGKPICFMIMPYGKKATQAEAGNGVADLDFNARGTMLMRR